jgi:hypothetical protein
MEPAIAVGMQTAPVYSLPHRLDEPQAHQNASSVAPIAVRRLEARTNLVDAALPTLFTPAGSGQGELVWVISPALQQRISVASRLVVVLVIGGCCRCSRGGVF